MIAAQKMSLLSKNNSLQLDRKRKKKDQKQIKMNGAVSHSKIAWKGERN
jgi:hypothetical protein